MDEPIQLDFFRKTKAKPSKPVKPSNVYRFESGEYKGRSVEQVAVQDYHHLLKYYNKITSGGNQKHEGIRGRAVKVVNTLENLVPVGTCSIPDCPGPARHFVVYRNGTDYVDVDVSDVFCDEPKHKRCMNDRDRHDYAANFSIFRTNHFGSKRNAEIIAKALFKIAGYDEFRKARKEDSFCDAQNLADFVDLIGK